MRQVKEEQLSTSALLDSLQAKHVSPVLIAALVDQRIQSRQIGDAAKRDWIAMLRSRATSDEVRCVLDTMDRLIRSGRFYLSFGP